ncbi:MAG: hypothetical protein KAU20_04530, partial [Nanoarchaeota archaeon]|nr:hypothetical protein [Nanoarchaeota archaeon]
FYAHKERNMIELLVQMLRSLPIEELKGHNDLLVLKGVHKLPTSLLGVKKQLKFKKLWQRKE